MTLQIRARLVTVLVVSLTLLMTAACSINKIGSSIPLSTPSNSPDALSTISFDDMNEIVTSVLHVLKCEQVLPVYDDIYNWDRAVGADCIHKDSSITSILVYQTSGSPNTAVQAWDGMLGDDVLAIISSHLLITGQSNVITDLSEKLTEIGSIIREVPSPPPPDTVHDAIGMCSAFVASHIAAFAAKTPEPERDIAELDNIFPGYRRWITELDESGRIDPLIGLEDRDSAGFESELSKFGPETKKFCNSAVKKTEIIK